MSKQASKSFQKENIYNRIQRIAQYIERQGKHLSAKNLETFLKYNNDMVVCGISDSTRYKNLDHFGLLTKMMQKDWADVI